MMNYQSTNKLALMTVIALTMNAVPVFAQESVSDTLPDVVDADALPDGEVFEDSDNDGYPDVTEDEEGTDPFDPEDNPIIRMVEQQEGAIQTKAAVPAEQCRRTFRQIGNDLCINERPQRALGFHQAMINCRIQKARVATYGDLSFIYLTSPVDSQYNPLGRWIGPDLVSDDRVLVGNRSITTDNDGDENNFEGTTSKSDKPREFWCAHDLDNF